MVKLPEHFDKNEWFVIISILILVICFFMLPRITPRRLTLTIFLFFAVLGLTADVLIGVSYPADFYVIMDSPKLELFDLLVYAGNYPLFGYFFAYVIYKWRMRTAHLLWFVPFWCLLAVGIEWLSLQFKIYTYQNGWTLGLSAAVYLLTYTFCAIVTKGLDRLWTAGKKDDGYA